MNKEITSRVNAYLKEKGIKKTQIAKKINWKHQTVIAQLNGSRCISAELLAEIVNAYPDINKDFIFTGEGDPVVKKKAITANESQTPSSQKMKDEIEELKIQLREKDAQISVLKSLIMNNE